MTKLGIFMLALAVVTGFAGTDFALGAHVKHEAHHPPKKHHSSKPHHPGKEHQSSTKRLQETDDHWEAPASAANQPNPVRASMKSIRRGQKLFQTFCSNCHGPEGKGDGAAGRGLSPKPTNLAAMSGKHLDGNFAWKISIGRGAMPGWKGVLQENQIWDLVNFIQFLKERK